MEKDIIGIAKKLVDSKDRMAQAFINTGASTVSINMYVPFDIVKGVVSKEFKLQVDTFLGKDGILRIENSDLYDSYPEKYNGSEVVDLGRFRNHLLDIGLIDSMSDAITDREIEDKVDIIKYEALANLAITLPFVRGYETLEGGEVMK